MKVDFNPIMIDLGLIKVSWYGMMYVLGILSPPICSSDTR